MADSCRSKGYGMVWYGVVWCGVVWCGVVWRGVAWRGSVLTNTGFIAMILNSAFIVLSLHFDTQPYKRLKNENRFDHLWCLQVCCCLLVPEQ